MKKILFAFVLLLVAAGVQAQKTHPDRLCNNSIAIVEF